MLSALAAVALFTLSSFTAVLSQWDFSQAKLGLPSQGKASRDSRATKPTAHAGCFSVSIIHRTLTSTTGSLTCTQMKIHAIAHGGCTVTVRESALKVDSGRKIPCRTGESNVRRRHAGPMLYQLSYIPAQYQFGRSTYVALTSGICKLRTLL